MRNDKYRAVFNRLETDAEFRARVRAKRGVGFVVVERETTRSGYWGIPVKSVDRVTLYIDELSGAALDDAAWESVKLQRRIVEDVSR